LRELVRLDLLPTLRAQAPIDVAIRARREAYKISMSALRHDMALINAGVTAAALNS